MIEMRKILIVIAVILSSCSANQRLTRLVKQHPELLSKDTLTVKDTVYIKENKTDTVVSIQNLTDTLTITKDRLVVKAIVRHDSLFISGDCKADTIYKEIKVPYDRIIVKPLTTLERLESYWWILLLIVIIIIGSIIIKIVKK